MWSQRAERPRLDERNGALGHAGLTVATPRFVVRDVSARTVGTRGIAPACWSCVPPDVCSLVRRDHDDLDRLLVAVVDPTGHPDELRAALDEFTLAFAVHVTAEAKVLGALTLALPAAAAIAQLAAAMRDEHACQQRAIDALAQLVPGTEGWFTRALELRVLVVDHAARAHLMRWTLQDRVPLGLHRALASRYATERLRALGRTSPAALARAQLAVA